MLSNLKDFIKDNQEELILLIGVVLISFLSFAAGFIVAKQQEKEPLRFEEQGSAPQILTDRQDHAQSIIFAKIC